MLATSTAHKRQIKILLIVSIVFFVIMMFAFSFTAYTTSQHSTLRIDNTIFAWLHTIRNPLMTHLMSAITFLGSRYFLFPCYTFLVVYTVFIQKKLLFAIALAFTGFLGNELLYLMQNVFDRVRPANPLLSYVKGYSYPSGHSFASFVFAGLLIFLVWQKDLPTKWKLTYAITLFLIASIIAISRAYLQVHYPTDVLGGFYLSILWLIPCWWILYLINDSYR